MTVFVKMHANGNDFMIIDAWHSKTPIVSSTKRIQQWSHRQTGIGFDQLLWVSSPGNSRAEAKCRIFNADGSEAGQCGHGIACVASWLYQKDYVQTTAFSIATSAGIWSVQLNQNGWVTVDLGQPIWEPDHIPLIAPRAHRLYPLACPDQANAPLKTAYAVLQRKQLDYLIELKHLLPQQSIIWNRNLEAILHKSANLLCGALALGNPHCVIPIRDIADFTTELGSLLSEHPNFPEQTNVALMQMLTPSHIILKVYERGVGFNRACGSGACAAVIVGRLLGYLASEVTVEFASDGDKVQVTWTACKTSVQLHTQIHLVFEGQVGLEEISFL